MWRGRHLIAALACGLAVTYTVGALRPAPPATVPVVVTAHALDIGSTVRATDVRIAQVPPSMVPESAVTSAADIEGRRVAVDLPAGVILVDGLTAADLTSAAPPGTVVASVQLDSAVASVLTPGMRIDLIGPAADWGLGVSDDADALRIVPSPYLARSAIVVPGVEVKKSGGLLGTSDAQVVTLVAVTPEEATRLAEYAGRGRITAVLVP